MKVNLVKLEKALLDEYRYKLRFFNETYAGKTLYNVELVKAKVCESQIEMLDTILTAIQESVEKE